jgi:septum formation protein
MLLRRLGITFEIDAGNVDERPPVPGETPGAYALALARLKADDGARRRPNALVLGADTVVAIDGLMLAKPVDEDDAVRMLSLLAGRTHTVVTAVAMRGLCRGEGTEEAAVRMRAAAETEIRAYARSGEPLDKAGGYAIQETGGRFVERVTGCYETVVGLPLCLVAQLLAECGSAPPIAPSCRHTQ